MNTLRQLIEEAASLASPAHDCQTMGHKWRMTGGRACPYETRYGGGCRNSSQPVFECSECPDVDYGEQGGPAYEVCVLQGPCDPFCEIITSRTVVQGEPPP